MSKQFMESNLNRLERAVSHYDKAVNELMDSMQELIAPHLHQNAPSVMPLVVKNWQRSTCLITSAAPAVLVFSLKTPS